MMIGGGGGVDRGCGSGGAGSDSGGGSSRTVDMIDRRC